MQREHQLCQGWEFNLPPFSLSASKWLDVHSSIFFFFWVGVRCRCPYVLFLTHSQPIVWNRFSLNLKLTDSARLSVQQAPRILLTLFLAEIIDVYHNSQVFTEVLRGLTQVITCDAIALSTGPLLHPQPEVIFLTVTFEEWVFLLILF